MLKKSFVWLFLFVILGIVNYSIYKKEQVIKNGKTFYLKLAPKDPRSMMQGDYMALRFAIDRDIKSALKRENGLKDTYTILKNGDGYVVVKLDKHSVAKFDRVYHDKESLKDDELRLRYSVKEHKLVFATDSFFFQEGDAKKYEKAKYGEFKADESGEFLLVDLTSKDFNPPKPKPKPKPKSQKVKPSTKVKVKNKKVKNKKTYRRKRFYTFDSIIKRKKLIKSQKHLTGKLKKEYEEDSKQTTNYIFIAIKYYQDERFSRLLKGIKNLDIRERDGMPMIYYAIQYQNLYAVKELLKRGVSFKNRFAKKTIHTLAWYGAEDVGVDFLRKLLELGLDPSYTHKKKMSLIYASAYRCQYKTSKLLMEYGADPYTEFFGKNALSATIQKCKNHPEYQKLLEVLSDKRHKDDKK